MNALSAAQTAKLVELGKHSILIRLHNRRNAAYNRSVLKAVRDHRYTTDPRTLLEAVQAADQGLEPITDADVLAYLNR